MIFIALFKQIPDIGHVKIDQSTKRLIREGVPNILNPFDYHAVEAALALRDKLGGKAIAITMGPPHFKQSADEVLAMGVDAVIHLSDRAFAGSDTLATSRALALAVRKFAGKELGAIFAGKYSWDGETGHVGPQVAEMLGLAHVSGVASIEMEGLTAVVDREAEDGVEKIRVDLPAVFTVTDRTNSPRPPGRARGEYIVISASELTDNTSLFGSEGSPTYVADLREEPLERENRVLIDARERPELGVEAILEYIKKALAEGSGESLRQAPPSPSKGGPEIYVLAEEGLSGIKRVSYELLGKAVELAEMLGGSVTAIYGGEEKAEELIARGADKVILLRGADPRDYIAHAESLSRLVLNRRPWAVVAPSTSYGKDVLARVAARLGLGLTADCIDLKVENGKLAQFKPAFGGSIVSIIYSKTYPQMATIRPGIFQPLEPNYNRSGAVEEVRISPRLTILEKRGIEFELPDPQHARIVVGVGMGFKKKENVQMAIDLAKALGGAVAATRNVVLRGWLPYYVQVGVSGKAVAPHLYIALGIRGDINHLVGIRKARHIIAVNINKNADIFKIANLGVIGDIFKIVPLLIERIKKM